MPMSALSSSPRANNNNNNNNNNSNHDVIQINNNQATSQRRISAATSPQVIINLLVCCCCCCCCCCFLFFSTPKQIIHEASVRIPLSLSSYSPTPPHSTPLPGDGFCEQRQSDWHAASSYCDHCSTLLSHRYSKNKLNALRTSL